MMKSRDSAGWTVIVGGVALAIYGAFWHPTQTVTLGLCMALLFLVGFHYFDDRLNRIERKLDALSEGTCRTAVGKVE